jgi:hypothetical protein
MALYCTLNILLFAPLRAFPGRVDALVSPFGNVKHVRVNTRCYEVAAMQAMRDDQSRVGG